ncbi:MAG: glycosyltransferase [Thermodesulfobacteriota bacterium]
MRLLFLITGLNYGGAESQLVRLANRLKFRGWDVLVVSLMPPLAYAEELEAAGIPVFSLGIKRKLPDPWPVIRLVKLIRKWRPRIVHSHMVHANLLVRIARPLAPVPVLICTAHSIDEGGHFREILYRLTDPLCELTIQVSEAGQERYLRVGAVPRHKIRYIPNGVDTMRFRPDHKVRLGLQKKLGIEDHFVWLTVGRFAPQKDYPNLLQAFIYITRENPKTVLLIAGDGPLRPAVQGLVHELGLDNKVQFLGIRRDVCELMSAADAYVMSSAREGMPMVLLEASAMALPIVATDVGGNSEVVIEGQSGFLVPPKNPLALAQAMRRLMELPDEERRKMGEAARRHIEAKFAIDRVVDMWEALYHELLAKKVYRYER